MTFVVKTSLALMLCFFTSIFPAYELQDTIHSLNEENLHLQHRLENLTHALQDLKHLLFEYSKGEEYGSEYQHAWKEWSQYGISPETHQILKQALCFPELHGSAESAFNCLSLCFLLCILHIALDLC